VQKLVAYIGCRAEPSCLVGWEVLKAGWDLLPLSTNRSTKREAAAAYRRA
jgi:hypothetical protein